MSSGADRQYNHDANEQWIASLVERTADAFRSHQHFANLAHANSADADAFLHKAVRGFVLEFLRQVRDDSPFLNSIDKSQMTVDDHKRVEEESIPGLYHATSCLKWIRKELPQATAETHKKILGDMIAFTAVFFKDSFFDIAEKDEIEKINNISIRYDMHAIRTLLDRTDTTGRGERS